MTLSSHNKRWLTAAVGLPVLALCFFLGSWAVYCILVLASCLGQFEFYSMFWPKGQRNGHKVLGIAFGVLLLTISLISNPGWAMLSMLIMFWGLNMFFLFRYDATPGTAGYAESAVLVSGLLYLPAVLQLALHLQPLELVLVLLACFASDTGAFYSGAWFGSRKIWPAISPKKTWAGSVGGLLLCVLICLAMGAIAGDSLWTTAMWKNPRFAMFETPPLWTWVALGALLNLLAQFGDFFESALKRSRDIKDSGYLLPGHGGLLDRIDSLLFALPGYVAFKMLYLL